MKYQIEKSGETLKIKIENVGEHKDKVRHDLHTGFRPLLIRPGALEENAMGKGKETRAPG
jgi:hypothetical protein